MNKHLFVAYFRTTTGGKMAKSQPQQKIRTNFGLKSKIYGHLKQVINTPTVLKKPNSLNQLSYVKGKVDARNMIVMRNKNKIPDARNKINLKRLGYSSESQKVNLINIPFGLKPRLQRKSELRNVSCHPTSLQVRLLIDDFKSILISF